jgi:hypothetical protein
VNGTNVSVVSDESAIAPLVSRYAAAGSPVSLVNVSEPYGILRYANDLKAGPEKSCMIITGMDRFPCVDRPSCLYACFSVPVCSQIGQAGWSFMDTMLDYKRSIDYTNIVLDNATNSASIFGQSPSYATALQALADMSELNRAETKVIFHPLFTSYGFCQPAEYAMPGQIEAKRALLDYLDDNCLYGEETGIVNQSAHLASKLAAFENRPLPKNATAPTTPASVKNATAGNVTACAIPETGQANTGAGACCAFGVCSIAGVDKIGGLCWEWWLLILAFLALCIAVLLYNKK